MQSLAPGFSMAWPNSGCCRPRRMNQYMRDLSSVLWHVTLSLSKEKPANLVLSVPCTCVHTNTQTLRQNNDRWTTGRYVMTPTPSPVRRLEFQNNPEPLLPTRITLPIAHSSLLTGLSHFPLLLWSSKLFSLKRFVVLIVAFLFLRKHLRWVVVLVFGPLVETLLGVPATHTAVPGSNLAQWVDSSCPMMQTLGGSSNCVLPAPWNPGLRSQLLLWCGPALEVISIWGINQQKGDVSSLSLSLNRKWINN